MMMMMMMSSTCKMSKTGVIVSRSSASPSALEAQIVSALVDYILLALPFPLVWQGTFSKVVFLPFFAICELPVENCGLLWRKQRHKPEETKTKTKAKIRNKDKDRHDDKNMVMITSPTCAPR